jgi:uncharacterized membrane protein YkoI
MVTYTSRRKKMRPSFRCLAVVTVALLTAMANTTHAQGPVPIVEEMPGLLAQASISPASARLTAFGEFPGARMVAAEIRTQDNHLVFAFQFQYSGHHTNEQVLIDAHTGQVACVEYSVDEDRGGLFVVSGPPELVSLVESGYEHARQTVRNSVRNGHVVQCRLRVENAKKTFVFDVEFSNDHATRQVLINATTGTLVSGLQPS